MEENKKPEDIKPEELKGMRRFEIPKIWLEKFKLQINRPYNDKDSLFEIYLKNATVYIFTQYLETPPNKLHLVNFENIYDNIVHAIFNVATTYEQNPDINLINDYGSVVDSNMIYRILGPFTEYFRSYKTSEWVNIFEYDTSLPNPTVDDILAKIKELNLTIENIKVVSNNVIDRTNELKQELHDFAAYIEPKIPKPEQFDEIKNKVADFRDKLQEQEAILGDLKRKQEKQEEKTAEIEPKVEEIENKANENIQKISENKVAIDAVIEKNTQQDTAIENLKTRVEGIVIPDHSNFAVKNGRNNFTVSQVINGHLESLGLYKLGASQNILQIKNQNAKDANILFEQNNVGYRNHCYFNLMHKFSNKNEVKLFSISTRQENAGIYFLCESNKLTFENDTTIDNVAEPTTDKQAATKKYVDDAIANINIQTPPPAVDLTPINNEIDLLKTKTDVTNNNLTDLDDRFTRLNNEAAKKAVDNEFISQTIKGNAAFVSFKSSDNSRKGYVGKSSSNSNNIELSAETNSLILNARQNVFINAGDGYNIRINQKPTQDTSIANKKYVDDKFASIQLPPAVDLTPINDEINLLKTKTDDTNASIANVETRLTNLSNVAVKNNIENTFATHQVINGFVKSSLGLYKDAASATILTLKNQGEKKQFIDFIQNTNQGFRNYCNFGIRIKYGNQNDNQYSTVFNIQTRNTGAGIFITAESNKINFTSETKVSGILTPTDATDAANKKYVDDAIANINIQAPSDSKKYKIIDITADVINSIDQETIIIPYETLDVTKFYDIKIVVKSETQSDATIFINPLQLMYAGGSAPGFIIVLIKSFQELGISENEKIFLYYKEEEVMKN